jgi:cobyrinic acid a,c-diamide synthase
MSFIIAAPASGSGKTTLTLGLLRALARRGVNVRGAKSGPDYIDPQFHAAACGKPCYNLDAWAMSPDRIREIARQPEFQIIEGAMGLFDGAPPDGKGSTADLARILGLPVVLVIDAAAMAQSVAPLAAGFARHDPQVRIAGVILNRVGSDRHERMLRMAMAPTGLSVLGAVRRSADIARPARHLGLVQPGEMPDLEPFLERAADLVEGSVDLDALRALEDQPAAATSPRDVTQPDLTNGQTIAIARDAAFAFRYALDDVTLAQSGATLRYFSPLADDPVPPADLIILPGGYPELHAATIAGATTFLQTLRAAAHDTTIKGECGGYMVLGEVMTDARGQDHRMAGLLPLHTSFAQRKLHLGYRRLRDLVTGATGISAHEFHYATTVRADGTPLYAASDAEGHDLGRIGLIDGNVSGSFAHIIT